MDLQIRVRKLVWFTLLLVAGCNVQAGKNHYILAERLFSDQKYGAAVDEFKKIIEEDPRGTLGQQALFRVAMTQYLYLDNYVDAVKNFRQFAQMSQNTELVYQAEKCIGEILFSKLQNYKLAVDQYKRLLDKYPDSKDRDLFLMRMGKSYYAALDFDHAIDTYRELFRKYPKNPLAPEALYEIGNTYFTRGNTELHDCESAIEAFQEVLRGFPGTPQAYSAQFGMGNCFEEQERFDDALRTYEKILDHYPSRRVVEAKIKHLKGRLSKAH